jgi:hypothetical protein
MRATRDDQANLMLLSGIVITIAFVLTALTLSQVSSLERASAADATTPVIAEWRFVHDRLASNLRTAVAPDTKNATFNNTIFPAIAATFRNIEAEKGFDTSMRLAFGAENAKNERSLVSAGSYAAYSDDGRTLFNWAQDPNLDDGLVWKNPCPDPSGPVGGCIAGVYVVVHLSDGLSSIDESILFAVNQ